MYPRPVRRAALGAVLTAMVLTVTAGCSSSDPSPELSPTPPPSPTAAATGKVAPPLPPAATAHTKAGAIAFVRHYIDLINYTQATLDDAPIKIVEAAQCKSCTSARAFIKRVRTAHGSIQGGAWDADRVLAVEPARGQGTLSVPVAIHYGPQVVTTGSKVKRYRGGNNLINFFTAWRGDRWVMTQWSHAK